LRNNHPKFAVVGHPNKGKSSIVASLALDDSVAISDTPGTTTKYRSFPLVVDGKTLYELFDTPGFQRARRVFEWLDIDSTTPAMQRVHRLREFVNEFRDDSRFNDDIELLIPILEGAGIIYIVDASKPFAPEYELEMQLLSFTGQPSMALLNHIGDEDYSAEWKNVLNHYFKMVRTYNPMKAKLKEHIEVLEAIAQLNEEWTPLIKESINAFVQYHKSNIQKSADIITSYVIDTLSFQLKKPQDSISYEQLQSQYKSALREYESKMQKKLEEVFNHTSLQKEINNLELNSMDMFSQESMSVFGLSQKDVVMMGASSGAITGAALDVLTVGHTLLLGGAIGAIVGGVGAYLGYDKVSDAKLLGKSIAQRYITIGPISNTNFAFVILTRALYYAMVLKNLSHANRSKITLNLDESFASKILNSTQKKELEKLHKKIKDNKEISNEDISKYSDILVEVLDS
jgi:tRNA U34 5-carboxymethylaminomethyl modifying GTPase MnmE/TrmE